MYQTSITPAAARKIGQRFLRNQAYIFLSYTNRCEIRVESWIEKQIALSLELDPLVRKFQAQPFVIELNSGLVFPNRAEAEKSLKGVLPRKPKLLYTPDIRAERATGVIIYEGKWSTQVEEFSEKACLAEARFREKGWRFSLHTQLEFWEQPLSDNLSHFYSLKGVKVNPELDILRSFLDAEATEHPQFILLNDLARIAGVKPATVLQGALKGLLGFDMRAESFHQNPMITTRRTGLEGLL